MMSNFTASTLISYDWRDNVAHVHDQSAVDLSQRCTGFIYQASLLPINWDGADDGYMPFPPNTHLSLVYKSRNCSLLVQSVKWIYKSLLFGKLKSTKKQNKKKTFLNFKIIGLDFLTAPGDDVVSMAESIAVLENVQLLVIIHCGMICYHLICIVLLHFSFQQLLVFSNDAIDHGRN